MKHRLPRFLLALLALAALASSCAPRRAVLPADRLSQPFDVVGAMTVGEGGVVVCEDSMAARIGADILRRGGNAVDAIVATAFALAVTEPEAGNIGGGGFLVAWDARTKEAWTLDFRETAPAAADSGMYRRLDAAGVEAPSLNGATSGGIPGTVDGLYRALQKGGSGAITWRDVIQPAVGLARDGFVVGPRLARVLEEAASGLGRYGSTRAVFFRDGRVLREGERLVQDDLAASLAAIQRNGPAEFYRGALARKMVDGVQGAGGVWSAADLSSYESIVREPVRIPFPGRDGVEIIAMPPPGSGGVVLAQALALLDAQGALSMGPGTRRACALIEALRLAFVERNQHLGDPDYMDMSVDTLLSDGHLADLAARLPDAPPGLSSRLMPQAAHESDQTTQIVAMDRWGGAVSLTYTINDDFGSKWVVPGTGILLNDEMDDFDARPGQPNLYGLVGTGVNRVRPGARMLSSMSPVIVTKGGSVWLTLGSRGGPRILTSVLQVLLRRIVDDDDLLDAVAAPRIHHQWLPDAVWFERTAPDRALRRSLERTGYATRDRWDIGRVFAAERLDDGRFLGVRDPRANGLAAIATPGSGAR